MLMLVLIPIAIGLFLGIIILRQRFVDLAGQLARSSRLDGFSFIQRGLEILQFVAEQDEKYVFGLVQIGAICSIIYMALTMLWAYASLRAYSVDLSASIVVFVNSCIELISWLPIQVFGGLGVAETSQVYLYGLFGIPAAQMATVSVGLRVILYLFNLISLLYLPSQAFFRRKYSF